MNYKFYIMTLCVILGLSSCTETEPEVGTSYRETFITGYLTPTSITVSVGSLGTARAIQRQDKRIIVSFDGNMIREGSGFKELSIQNGDTSFKRIALPGWTEVLNDSIQSIRVETLDDFNAQYPAGSDISTITEMLYLSYIDYIQNGYKETEQDGMGTVDWNEWYSPLPPIPRSSTRIKKSLPEVNTSNTKLMVLPSFQLKFLKKPEGSGKHRFKLSIKTSNMYAEKTFEYDFQDPS